MDKHAKIVAFANQKGGVAKTTSAGAFGAEMSKRGYRTLLVDLDPQGNLSTSVDADNYGRPTMYELMTNRAEINSALQQINTYDILPANLLLHGLDQELTQMGKELRLKEKLESVLDQYDIIILDTPPSLGILTINAFACADEVIVPTTPSSFAASGISQLSMTINTVKKYYNPALKIVGILITKMNLRTNIGKEMRTVTNDVADKIGAPLYSKYIRCSVDVEEAQARKIDLLSFGGYSHVIEDYRSFVDEYLKGAQMA